MKPTFRTLLYAVIWFIIPDCFAQKIPYEKPFNPNAVQQVYYQRTLHIDSLEAVELFKLDQAYQAGVREILSNQNLDVEQRGKSLKELDLSFKKQLTSILNPEQFKRFEQKETYRKPVRVVKMNEKESPIMDKYKSGVPQKINQIDNKL